MVQRSNNAWPSGQFCGTDADLQALRSDLERRRRFRVEQLRALAAPLHPETSNKTGDAHADVTVALRSAATVALTDIEEALERIGGNRYGVCQACGTPIPLPRLQALPMIQWCSPCQPHETRARGVAVEPGGHGTASPALDLVEVWGHGSFPASDPPANW
jgi:RNA polymerase-binding transcription factor DksA